MVWKKRCLLVVFRALIIFFRRIFVVVMIMVMSMMFLLDALLYITVVRFMSVRTVHDVRGYVTMGDMREDADDNHTGQEESDQGKRSNGIRQSRSREVLFRGR